MRRPALAKASLNIRILVIRSRILESLQHFGAEPGIVGVTATDHLER